MKSIIFFFAILFVTATCFAGANPVLQNTYTTNVQTAADAYVASLLTNQNNSIYASNLVVNGTVTIVNTNSSITIPITVNYSNTYGGLIVQNISGATNASADIAVVNNAGSSSNFNLTMGINSSNFNSTTSFPGGTNTGYILMTGNYLNTNGGMPANLFIGTMQTGSIINFSVSSGGAGTNMTLSSNSLSLAVGMTFTGNGNGLTNLSVTSVTNNVITNSTILYTNSYQTINGTVTTTTAVVTTYGNNTVTNGILNNGTIFVASTLGVSTNLFTVYTNSPPSASPGAIDWYVPDVAVGSAQYLTNVVNVPTTVGLTRSGLILFTNTCLVSLGTNYCPNLTNTFPQFAVALTNNTYNIWATNGDIAVWVIAVGSFTNITYYPHP
jgi:hypothetical protein